jgi:hypothetical protein
MQFGGGGVTVSCGGHVAGRGGVESEHVQDLRLEVVVVDRLGGCQGLLVHRPRRGVITRQQGELTAGRQRQRQAPPVAELAEGPGCVVQPLAGLADGGAHERPSEPEQRVGRQPAITQGGRRLQRAAQQRLGLG